VKVLLEAGQAVCPYRYEYAGERLLVVEGGIVVRIADGEEIAVRGTPFALAPDRTGCTRCGTTVRRRRGVPRQRKQRGVPAESRRPCVLRREDGKRDHWERA